MIAAGFLLHREVFTLTPLFLALVVGDLIGDILWYYIGYFFAGPILQRHGKFFGLTPEIYEKAKALFHRHHEKVLLISKVTLGFGLALGTLMVAGATRVSFKKYIILNFLGELALVTTLLSIGYSFGGLYTYIADSFKIIFIVSVFVIVGLAIFGFSRFMKNNVSKL